MAASLLVSAYGLGFALFVFALPAPYTTLPPQLDGLAVFTGGSGRVKTALRAIQHGFDGPVLISGVNPGTTLDTMVRVADLTPSLSAAQLASVMLDSAQTTHQNMQSLAVWASTTGATHVGVITSTYHAARVALLGRLLAPQLHVHILAVQPEDVGLWLIWQEYNKLLVAPFLR